MNDKLKVIFKNNRFLYILARRIQRFKRKYKWPILGRGNKIVNKGVLFKVKYDIIGNNNIIEIGNRTVLSNLKIYIRGNNHFLKIGEDCFFRGGSVWFEDNDCQIFIGDKTSIESAHLAVTEPMRKILIGEDCMFSTDIEFRTGDSHSIIDHTTKMRINYAQDIVVGNHVWVGARSTVLKGVNIDDNVIVGTNSLVTSSVPAHSIVAGIPAKVIKNNADWLRERIYDQG